MGVVNIPPLGRWLPRPGRIKIDGNLLNCVNRSGKSNVMG